MLFLEFGDSALIFELRAFLRDVEKRARVGSDLRFSIEKASGCQIELPYAPGRTGKARYSRRPSKSAQGRDGSEDRVACAIAV